MKNANFLHNVVQTVLHNVEDCGLIKFENIVQRNILKAKPIKCLL
jgi:hypothetical protein